MTARYIEEHQSIEWKRASTGTGQGVGRISEKEGMRGCAKGRVGLRLRGTPHLEPSRSGSHWCAAGVCASNSKAMVVFAIRRVRFCGAGAGGQVLGIVTGIRISPAVLSTW